jgi:small subunit ribosomal protein S7
MQEEKIKKESEDIQTFKIFDGYDLSEVEVKDPGLKGVINLKQKLVLKEQGRENQKFGQTKINVVERLMNRVGVAGHRGKKHRIILGHATGKYSKNMKNVLKALEVIEKKKNENPVQILVRAIENSAPRDEITVIEYGGARYPQAVDVSPLRRINLAIRWLVQGSGDKAFGKKKKLFQALAEEIMGAAENNNESFAIRKRNESEKQADSAR